MLVHDPAGKLRGHAMVQRLPMDLIPDHSPVIGHTEDAAVLAAAMKLVASHVMPDHREAAGRVLAGTR